ncbi:MAG: PLP-dependent aminotransferase family protein [Proteobacteria bacterium]|nr:PLP-dependent aminotransferase family protein [Pseudomonadota bacterium]
MLTLPLDGKGPLHGQTYRALRGAILAGRLAPGARLASSRALAGELGVSRNTVLHAFERLVAEGYATAREGSGTFVADSLPGRRRERTRKRGQSARLRLSAVGRRIARDLPARGASWSLPREPLRFDFRYGEPAYSDLPLETWSRLLGRRARRLSVRRLAYQPPGGAAELREALAGYLARARGVVCDPEQLLIVQGSQQAIDLCTRLLVDPGDTAVLEEPHYTGFAFCLAAAGAEIAAIPTDADGLRVGELERVPRASLACVTPSHQFPAGGVLSLPRRLALLDWARRSGATVLEDDYDGEFRYQGQPLECLQSLDRDGRVVYVGTASKVLFPALRIGWAVVPPSLVRAFQDAKALTDTGTASVEQLAFADFVAEGHLERHVRRIRRLHAGRRAALLEAVDRELGDRGTVIGTAAGLHALLRLESLSARYVTRLRAACRERGVGVYPAAPFYARPPRRAELLLGYAALSEADIRAGIRRLAQAVNELGR